MKVIIIGGGTSGLVSAIYATDNGCDVTIIEKNNTLGKKILVTGNGRCNYFNEDFSSKHYVSESNIDELINDINKEKILNFFKKVGFISKIKDGYYYPYSNQAVSIQNSLITEIKNRNINIITDTLVENIQYINNSYQIKTNKGFFEADKVILATGSRALYNTDIEDIGYNILKKFGHRIFKPLPGLVQLKCEGNYFKDWAGIRCDAKLMLFSNNFLIKSEVGELQLTNYGISGICTLQLSNYAVRLIENNNKVNIRINFLDFLNIKDFNSFIEYFDKRNNTLKGRTVSEIFDTILNYKLSNLLIKLSKINLDKKYSDLTYSEKEILCSNMISFNLNIIGYNSYKEAQVSTGGVSLEEINLNTMESLKQKGLYITGELLDITGDCGGYNLGIAWLTGILAGENIND